MSTNNSSSPFGKMARIEELVLTSPTAPCLWARLTVPDTTFKPEGEYSINLVFSAEEADDIKEKATAHLAKFIEEQKKLLGKKSLSVANASPFKADTDKDSNETGKVRVAFKMKASVVSKKTGNKMEFKPAVFDKFGSAFSGDIGNGSKCRVSYEVNPYYTPALGAGLSFRLRAVQVLEVKGTSNSKDAKAFGFDTVEGEDLDEVVAKANASTPGVDPTTGDF